MSGRIRRWLDEGMGYELIGEWTARLVGATVAGVFTYFAWGWSEPVAVALAIVAFLFVLHVSRSGL